MKNIALTIAALVPLVVLVVSAQQNGGGSATSAPPQRAMGAGGAGGPGARQRPTLGERIAHYDPARRRASPRVHNGPGQLDYFALFNGGDIDTNLWFMHRGIIEPHSGIGEHFHNYCEEMFVIFDGEAQYTIDGHTAVIKAPGGAPSRMGHAHAIYNHTDKPVEWMNINVTAFRNVYDAFNLDDGRVGVTIDPIPQFMTMHLDRKLLRN